MNNQKGFAKIILVAVIVVLLGAVGYFTLHKPSTKQNVQIIPPAKNLPYSQEVFLSQTNKLEKLQIYKNDQYGFSFKYPGDWNMIVKENDIGLGSLVSIKAITGQTWGVDRDEFFGLVGCFGDMKTVDPFYLGDFRVSEPIKIDGVTTSIHRDQNRGLDTLKFYIPLIKQDSQRCGIFFHGFTDLTDIKKNIINSLDFTNNFEAFIGSVFKQFQTKPPTRG